MSVPPSSALSRFGVILGVLVVGVMAVAVIKSQDVSAPSTKIHITASFYPLANFTEHIGGSHVVVTTTTPSGSEPHEYEPTPSDIASAESSRLFIFNGAGLDPWAEKVAPQLRAKGIITLEATSFVQLRPAAGATNGTIDPHIWLDPIAVKAVATQIRNTLVQLDPAHQADYDLGNEQLQHDLDLLDTHFRTQLARCAQTTIVTSHAAFGYLAGEYKLKQVYLSGITPDEEPSAQRLSQVADQVRRQKITTIFYESLVSPKFADTIARETGATTAVLDPIEGLTPAEQANGDSYLTIMERNLAALRTALQCS